MNKKILNKLLLSLGTAGVVIAPLATVVSCGSKDSDNDKTTDAPEGKTTGAPGGHHSMEPLGTLHMSDFITQVITSQKDTFNKRLSDFNKTLELKNYRSMIQSLTKEDVKTILVFALNELKVSPPVQAVLSTALNSLIKDDTLKLIQSAFGLIFGTRNAFPNFKTTMADPKLSFLDKIGQVISSSAANVMTVAKTAHLDLDQMIGSKLGGADIHVQKLFEGLPKIFAFLEKAGKDHSVPADTSQEYKDFKAAVDAISGNETLTGIIDKALFQGLGKFTHDEWKFILKGFLKAPAKTEDQTPDEYKAIIDAMPAKIENFATLITHLLTTGWQSAFGKITDDTYNGDPKNIFMQNLLNAFPLAILEDSDSDATTYEADVKADWKQNGANLGKLLLGITTDNYVAGVNDAAMKGFGHEFAQIVKSGLNAYISTDGNFTKLFKALSPFLSDGQVGGALPVSFLKIRDTMINPLAGQDELLDRLGGLLDTLLNKGIVYLVPDDLKAVADTLQFLDLSFVNGKITPTLVNAGVSLLGTLFGVDLSENLDQTKTEEKVKIDAMTFVDRDNNAHDEDLYIPLISTDNSVDPKIAIKDNIDKGTSIYGIKRIVANVQIAEQAYITSISKLQQAHVHLSATLKDLWDNASSKISAIVGREGDVDGFANSSDPAYDVFDEFKHLAKYSLPVVSNKLPTLATVEDIDKYWEDVMAKYNAIIKYIQAHPKSWVTS